MNSAARMESAPKASGLPFVFAAGEGEVSFSAWAASRRGMIEQTLQRHGAVLFRGYGVDTPEKLAAVAAATSTGNASFAEESSPRTRVAGDVFTSTDYPSQYPIQFHNEFSYASEWPMKLYFGCLVAPKKGGATPIADTRGILRRLSPATRARFASKKVTYVRNYMPGLGVSWQTAFRTSSRSEVAEQCRARGIACEWIDDVTLRTRQVGDAIVRHPRTGEEVWFNHGFFFNIHALEPVEVREALLEEGEDAFSTNTHFGDGTPIPEDVIEEIRSAYVEEGVALPWRAGDVLLVDNMLASHGRAPFEGDRRIVVLMAEGFRRVDLQTTT
jgi:alpha-ketoglutarate-dependent taurine dioxygenase